MWVYACLYDVFRLSHELMSFEVCQFSSSVYLLEMFVIIRKFMSIQALMCAPLMRVLYRSLQGF